MSSGRVGEVERERSSRPGAGGSAERLLTAGVVLLAPEDTVLDAMLEGWEAQQRSRMLAGPTIEHRSQIVRRFVEFTGDYPWRWAPADVEEWTAELVTGGLAHSTIRN